MVEVDPRLFVTCRLCLEVEGQFQIVPSVQQQIKFCFDIDVEPFDRLPQLICRKCEQILTQYYVIKKNFIEKQKELKVKVQDNVNKLSLFQKSESGNSASIHDNGITRKKKHKTKRAKKRKIVKRILSSSSDELDAYDTSTSQIKQIYKYEECNKGSPPWEANLCKYFVCRICCRKFLDKEGITLHIGEHSNLHNKYKNIFNISCLVVMEKIDGKPNVINNDKAVVYRSDSYIQNEHNPYYYIIYHPRNYSFPLKSSVIQSSREEENGLNGSSILHKRSRILSGSSSETVVINQREHRDLSQVIDCINIADSSDNASCESNEKSQTSSIDYRNEDNIDSKSINNIIRVCHNRYTKRFNFSEKKMYNVPKDSFLKHKVLSIGRKIINNQSVNCTGLLRYLEYKDLKVIWKETCVLNTNTDAKLVRVVTRMRGNDSSETNKEDWKNINEFVEDDEESFRRVHIFKKLKNLNNFKDKHELQSNKTFINEETTSTELLPRISSVYSNLNLEISKTVDPDIQLKKLLNTSPVLNPKQLPKNKQMSNDSSAIKISKVYSTLDTTTACIDANEVNWNNDQISPSMPVIQSTESLAPQQESLAEVPSLYSNPQKFYPRIKVKPVSELMPETSTGNTNPQDSIFNNDTQNTVSYDNTTRYIDNTSNSYQLGYSSIPTSNYVSSNASFPSGRVTTTNSSKATSTVKECVIMDTVEFPNEKTDSPFQYVRNLLLVHNMNLLDTDSPLPAGTACLIQLKFLYQQEKCQPIILFWGLFCCKNTFCIKIRDMQQRDINLNKLTAPWQWQLLKINNNDVVNKVLEAAKKISNETYDYTNYLFTLLKSIKCSTI